MLPLYIKASLITMINITMCSANQSRSASRIFLSALVIASIAWISHELQHEPIFTVLLDSGSTALQWMFLNTTLTQQDNLQHSFVLIKLKSFLLNGRWMSAVPTMYRYLPGFCLSLMNNKAKWARESLRFVWTTQFNGIMFFPQRLKYSVNAQCVHFLHHTSTVEGN